MASQVTPATELRIRAATPADAEACGRICYQAFYGINTKHGFPPDFPSAEIAIGFVEMLFSHPGFYCVVGERDGQIIGSNCLDVRSREIAGIGPITIAPESQDRAIGRALMNAITQRGWEMGYPGIRLVQGGFHMRSLSLYSKLGFDVREPLIVMNGTPLNRATPGYLVRPAMPADVEACNQLCRNTHGHDRAGELQDAIHANGARVVERGGGITGYTTMIGFGGHAVAETNGDLQALIAAADAIMGPGILAPTRNSELFRWCLQNGLRAVLPVTLMTMGRYAEPRTPWLPSILY